MRALAVAIFAFVAAWTPVVAAQADIRPQQVEALDRQGATEIIVRREPGLTAAKRADIRADADVTLTRRSTIKDTEVVRADKGELAEAIAELNRDPEVVYAEPVVVLSAQSADTYYGSLWALENVGQNGTVDADMDVPEAWTKATGAGVTVGIVDTGVLTSHPDLAAQVAFNALETGTDGLGRDKRSNGVDDDGNGYVDDWNGWDFVAAYPSIGVYEGDGTPGPDNVAQDDHGHGTHVAGTVAAQRDNNEGIAGVAPAAKITPLRALGSNGRGTNLAIAEAFDYAGRMGLRVVNASLGGPGLDQTQLAAIQKHPNTLYVIAAGNDNVNTDVTPYGPCALQAANIMCVGASDENDRRASFSNYGATSVDVFAPGTTILSTYTSQPYAYLWGTSMASPNAAGVAALVLSARPGATALDIKSAIMASTEARPDLAGKSVTGGRVNADRALNGVLNGAPVNVTPPAITGTPQQGITLGATSGNWNPPGTSYTYSWQRSTDGSTWTTIVGATGSTYTPGASDIGARLRVAVTATNPYGVASATSQAVGPVISGAPVNTSRPVINGTPRRGQVLTVSAAFSPAGTSYAYQWQRSTDGVTWTTIGANTSSYTLTTAERDARVRVTVTATNAYGQASATSDPIGPVVHDPPVSTTAPAVTGTTQRTFTLTANPGSWEGGGNTYRYQWQRDGADIPGATASSYKLVKDDEGARLRVLVTATNPDGTVERASDATAAPVSPFPPANLVAPVITGTPQRSRTLYATRGTWTGPDNMYAYQWQRDFGEGYVDIPGATASAYTLTSPTWTRPCACSSPPRTPTPRSWRPASRPRRCSRPGRSTNRRRRSAAPRRRPHPHRQRRFLDWLRQQHELSVAVVGRRQHVDEHRQRDGLHIRARHRRRRQPPAPAGDRHQSRRDRVGRQHRDGQGGQRAAREHRQAGGDRHRPAGVDAHRDARHLERQRQRVHVPVAAGRGRYPRRHRADVHADRRRRRRHRPRARRRRQSRRDRKRSQHADGDDRQRGPRQHGQAVARRHRPARAHPDGHIGQLERDREQHELPVAVLGRWRDLDGGRGRDGPDVRDRRRRRRQLPAPAGHGHEPRRDRLGRQHRLREGRRRPASQHRQAGAERHGAARVHAHRDVRQLERQRQRLHVPVAARHGRHPRRHRSVVHLGSRRRRRHRARARDRHEPRRDRRRRQRVDRHDPERAAHQHGRPDGHRNGSARLHADRHGGRLERDRQQHQLPVAALARPRRELAGHRRRDRRDVRAHGRRRGSEHPRARDDDEPRGHREPGQQRDRRRRGRWPGEHERADDLRDRAAHRRPDLDARHVDRQRQHHQLPVAALQRGLGQHRGRDRRVLRAHRRRRGRHRAAARHRHQPRRREHPGFRPDHDRERRAARQLEPADRHRPDAARHHPDRLGGLLDRAGARVRLPVAARRGPRIHGHRGCHGSGVPARRRRRGHEPAHPRHRHERRRERHGDELRVQRRACRAPGQHGRPDDLRHRAAHRDAHRDARRLERDRERVRLPVAAPRAGRPVRGHRGGDGGDLHARLARRRQADPAAGHRLEPRRHGQRLQRDDALGDGRTAAQHRAPERERGGQAGRDADGRAGRLDPRGRRLRLHVAARRRGHRGRHGPDLHAPGRGRRQDRPRQGHSDQRRRQRDRHLGRDGARRRAAREPRGAPPAPSGTAKETSTLTAVSGTWDTPGASFSYTWMRCPADATSITASCEEAGNGGTLTLAAADVGRRLGVRVTASSNGGATTADSALTATVVRLTLANSAAPSIAGNPYAGETLTGDTGRWTFPSAQLAYEWRRCDADGTCATVGDGSLRYTPMGEDVGHTIVLFVAATASGQSATAQSAPLAIRARPVPRSVSAPVVTGTAKRGRTLTAGAGTWTNDPSRFSYQWLRCNGGDCHEIAGATGDGYVLSKADVGFAITVVVTASNAFGSGSATAAPTGPVAAAPPVNTRVPVITGTVQQGATLTVGDYSWDATPDTAYSLAWLRRAGDGCAPIVGATGAQYTLVAADVGHTLVAVSTATNVDGSASARSAETAVATMAGPRWKTLPLISNSPGRVGDTVTMTPGTWSGPVVTSRTTELMRCTNVCVPRAAADNTYTIADGDLGAILRVRETASNVGGSSTVWSARYVGPVVSAQAAAAVLTSGTTRLRNAKGSTLAVAKLTAARASAAKTKRPKVTLRRSPKVKGKLVAWACPATISAGATPPPCSTKVTLRRSATLSLPPSTTGKVRVVVRSRR